VARGSAGVMSGEVVPYAAAAAAAVQLTCSSLGVHVGVVQPTSLSCVRGETCCSAGRGAAHVFPASKQPLAMSILA
jgi:hypothetical protein